jgi:hypothetical protein
MEVASETHRAVCGESLDREDVFKTFNFGFFMEDPYIQESYGWGPEHLQEKGAARSSVKSSLRNHPP